MKTSTRSLMVLLLAVPGLLGAAEDSAPTTPVATLQAALHAAATRPTLEARASHLGPAVDAAFDFHGLGRLILRRHWSQLDEAQQQQFVGTLRALTVANYADRFVASDSDALRFGPLTVTELPRGRAQVRSQLNRPSREPVQFDYIVQDGDAGWKILNVVASGVSDAALRSSQYTRIIEQEGFDSLIQRMRDEIRGIGL